MRKQSIRLLRLCFILSCVSFSASALRAQVAKETPFSEPTTTSPTAVYRVEYVVREIEKGKPVNARTYLLMAHSDLKGKADKAAFRVGSRVPILKSASTPGSPAPASVEYYDIGMNIDCRLWETDKGLIVDTYFEMNSVAGSEPSSTPSTPVTRRLYIQDDTLVVPGKSAVVGSIDDVTGDRRYEVEVTATKVK
jgi:hypothetical protein